MSLIDDARRLWREGAPSIYDTAFCGRCGKRRTGESTYDHDPDCPWLAMPRIVAVLEAGEAYVQEMEGQGERVDVLRRVRTYEAFVAALKGD
jgi:hypothetical protein